MIDRSLSNYPKGNDLVSAKCNSQNQLELKKFGTQAKFKFVNFFFGNSYLRNLTLFL